MTLSPHSVFAARCQAGPGCQRAVCFRIRLHSQAGDVLGPAADACADHLGDLVKALTRSARADGRGGYLEVCAVAPGARLSSGCFPFANISLTPPPGGDESRPWAAS